MTSTPNPPGDGWENAPGMSPEAPPPPPGYGAPPGQQWGGGPGGPPGYNTRPARNGLGIAALVLGIIGLLTSLFLIGGLFGFIAIILGFVARGRAKRGEATNGGVALGGIITGILAVLVTVAIIAAGAAFLNSDSGKKLRDCLENAQTQADQDACSRQFNEDFNQ